MSVEYIDHMGDDLSVVNAARVSLAKESVWNYTDDEFSDTFLDSRDEKLIEYLAKNNHITPFFHCIIKYRVKAPIFIARQFFRSNIGIARNEVSRRYVDTDPEFYLPEYFRPKAENIKQGSTDVEHAHNDYWNDYLKRQCELSLQTYQSMIQDGVAPEQARMILPQNMMTEWIETASLAACARIYNLRIDGHAQKEIQILAKKLGEMVQPLFPVCWKFLTNGTV